MDSKEDLIKKLIKKFPDISKSTATKFNKGEILKMLGIKKVTKKSPAKKPIKKVVTKKAPKRVVKKAPTKKSVSKKVAKKKTKKVTRTKKLKIPRKKSDKTLSADVVKLMGPGIKDSAKPKKEKKKPTKINKNVKLINRHFNNPKKWSSKRVEECIRKSKLKLRPHQEKVVKFIMSPNSHGLIVDHSMGTGKSITAATAAMCFLESNPKSKVIIVTPVSLIDNFHNAFNQYGVKSRDQNNIKVMSFHKLTNEVTAITTDTLQCSSEDMLIVDEVHNLKTTFKGGIPKLAGAILECAHKVKKVLLLSGTPIYNAAIDIANLITMVRGEKYPTLLKTSQLDALVNNPAAFKKYFKCSISYYKPPRDKDTFPSVFDHTRRVIMGPIYFSKYQAIEDDVLSKNPVNQNAFFIALRKASNNIDGCPKCHTIMDILTGKLYQNKYLNKPKYPNPKDTQKTVIYSYFKTEGVNLLGRALKVKGFSFEIISGDTSGPKRQKIVDRFNAGKVRILLFTKAAAEGLDLKGTRTIIIMEPYWHHNMIEQVKARGIRYLSHAGLPKEDRRVDIYNLILTKPDPPPKLVNPKGFAANLKLLKTYGVPEENIQKYAPVLEILYTDNPKPTIDQYMQAVSINKELKMSAFEKKLEEISIENDKGCV